MDWGNILVIVPTRQHANTPMTAEDIRNSVLRHIELHVDSAPARHLYSAPGTALSSTDCVTMP